MLFIKCNSKSCVLLHNLTQTDLYLYTKININSDINNVSQLISNGEWKSNTETYVRQIVLVSAVQFIPLSGHFFPVTKPKDFRADRPFVFFLSKDGVVFFVGRLRNPW